MNGAHILARSVRANTAVFIASLLWLMEGGPIQNVAINNRNVYVQYTHPHLYRYMDCISKKCLCDERFNFHIIYIYDALLKETKKPQVLPEQRCLRQPGK